MRTPFSDAPVLVARTAAVFAPAPIGVNTSSSIAVRNAAVCWKAFSALKIRSGVGRPAVVAVAIKFLRGRLSPSILHCTAVRRRLLLCAAIMVVGAQPGMAVPREASHQRNLLIKLFAPIADLLAYFFTPQPVAPAEPCATARLTTMKREVHRWHSPRLGIELGVVVYGHWGPPLLGFPTSAGDEWELESQGMIGALCDFIDAAQLKFCSVNSINGLPFYTKSPHPFHRPC